MHKLKLLLLTVILAFAFPTHLFADHHPEAETGEDEARPEPTDAEILLWLSNHLGNVDEPVRLRYEFERSGSYGDGFKDKVDLDVVQFNEDGSKSTFLEFFTGPRKQEVRNPSSLNFVRGNPVLGVFMQGDVYEMDRMTEGNWRYFQRRIMVAFSDAAQVEPVTVQFKGNEIDAHRVTIAPFANDPRRVHFDKYADKTYEFIVSEDVPGMLYEIRTVIPDNINIGAEPLVVEVLTLAEAQDVPADVLSRAGQ